MILVTGAAGKTGRAVIQALSARNTAVRALIHTQSQKESALSAGATEIVIGDMGQPVIYENAMDGISAVYFICPNVHPHELQFAELAIESAKMAAAEADTIPHIVYHSVLHPQVEAMPHHWHKMRVEELLFTSGLPFTILQPAAYMQNVLASWQNIVEKGTYPVPYSAETRHCMVDLRDVAEAAATVLLDPGHHKAIYELAGPEALSQSEVAEIIAGKINRPLTIKQIPNETWRQQAQTNGLGDYQIDALTKMFNYYDEHGLQGNPNVLTWLLKRPPTTFATFVDRLLVKQSRQKEK